MQNLDLPEPSEAEKQHSEKLCQLIKQTIDEAGGWIGFDQYMQQALYAAGLGYYSAGAQKFGEQGDFITAPELSPLFARTLARPVANLLEDIEDSVIIEFGAGSGQLAVDLLGELNDLSRLPQAYWIIELSAELKQRQYEKIKQAHPELLTRVQWLTVLPEKAINAIVIANEVLDAMPVKRFQINHGLCTELGVTVENDDLVLQSRPADAALQQQIKETGINLDAVEYQSEINLYIKPWVTALAQSTNKCAVYLIDYGYPRSEYYSAERSMGTCMGYYRHRTLDAPLWYPGLQDLTAFVDFTAVAESALQSGFDVDGFTSQGIFLLNCGLSEVVEQSVSENDMQRIQLHQQMKSLSLPSEMGERFKVMGLSKGLEQNIPGFEVRDFRYRL